MYGTTRKTADAMENLIVNVVKETGIVLDIASTDAGSENTSLIKRLQEKHGMNILWCHCSGYVLHLIAEAAYERVKSNWLLLSVGNGLAIIANIINVVRANWKEFVHLPQINLENRVTNLITEAKRECTKLYKEASSSTCFEMVDTRGCCFVVEQKLHSGATGFISNTNRVREERSPHL